MRRQLLSCTLACAYGYMRIHSLKACPILSTYELPFFAASEGSKGGWRFRSWGDVNPDWCSQSGLNQMANQNPGIK